MFNFIKKLWKNINDYLDKEAKERKEQFERDGGDVSGWG